MKKLSTKEYIAVFIAIIISVSFFWSSFSFLDISKNNTTKSSVATSFGSNKNKRPLIRQEVVNKIDFVKGIGKTADYGDTVFVHYVAKLDDGTVFDTSTDNPNPFVVTLGNGSVIAGWEIGVLGMKKNGIRRIIIPASLAYDSKRVVDDNGKTLIPKNSTISYDVVMLRIKKNNIE